MDKKNARLRRAKRSRCTMARNNATRLVVHRTPRHIYAQVIDATNENVIAAASTLEKEVRELGYTGNKDAAKTIGKLIAERAIEKGVSNVSFDRAGFQYHGRVAALADSAREAGLKF